MSEPQDRDEAMDMLDEKRRGLRRDFTVPPRITVYDETLERDVTYQVVPVDAADLEQPTFAAADEKHLDYAQLYAILERENDRLRALVRELRDPACPVVHGERVTWDEFRRVSADGP